MMRKGFAGFWVAGIGIILLAFMAPMITEIIGQTESSFVSSVGLPLWLMLPVLGFSLLFALIFWR